MGKTLEHRGPNDSGQYISEHAAFAHTRLAVIDLAGGIQPMKRNKNGYEYAIVYNGELYNTEDIRKDLLGKGYEFQTTSDTEVLLTAYIEYGTKCPEYLNGIFSFAIWDSFHRQCFLCRDRFGVKPLFYSITDQTVVFGSEIKALFEYPSIEPEINQYGLCELFGLGPARSPGCGVYKGVNEVMPGFAAIIDYSGMRLFPYWSLTARKHRDNYEQTVEKTRELLLDSIKRQLVSDVPICTLLSGGLDSSVVSAVAAKVLKEEGRQLDTYSFDYNENTKYFKASSFQPAQDRPFVDIMVDTTGSNHTYLECDSNSLYETLYDAVLAKDFVKTMQKAKDTIGFIKNLPCYIFQGRLKRSIRYVYQESVLMKSLEAIHGSLMKRHIIRIHFHGLKILTIEKVYCLPTFAECFQ
mgnify:CR=1 FL=1